VVQLDSEKLERWLNEGAEPTETVLRLMRMAKRSSPSAS